MSEHEFDVVVLGMGPGAEYVAGELARAGVSVAAVEERLVGGECPYWGCIPSKMMIRAAGLLTEGRRISGIAGSSVVSPSWAPVGKRIRVEATDDWDDKTAADRFTDAGGTLFRGHGRIIAPGQVSVSGDVLRARRGIVIGTGSAPVVPPVDGLAGTPFWTSRDAIETEQVPRSMVVLGGGPIGSELAQVFARFGAEVTMIEAAGQLLPMEEPESGAMLTDVFRREGIAVATGAAAQQVRYGDQEFTLTLEGGRQLRAEQLLVATGRRADLAGIGAGAAGLDEKAAYIETDAQMQAAPGVWAVGDVTGKGAFTHVSMYQAGIVAGQLLGHPRHDAEYHAVPRVTFTDPEIGAVGLNQAQAQEKLGEDDVVTATTQLADSARGWIHKAGNDGFIKLVADARRGVLVGATSAGPAGGEVLGLLALAVHAEIPVERLSQMIYAYPTMHRAVSQALDVLLEELAERDA